MISGYLTRMCPQEVLWQQWGPQKSGQQRDKKTLILLTQDFPRMSDSRANTNTLATKTCLLLWSEKCSHSHCLCLDFSESMLIAPLSIIPELPGPQILRKVILPCSLYKGNITQEELINCHSGLFYPFIPLIIIINAYMHILCYSWVVSKFEQVQPQSPKSSHPVTQKML
jgi:hypothetical protein